MYFSYDSAGPSRVLTLEKLKLFIAASSVIGTKLEPTQISFNRYMDKQTVTYTHIVEYNSAIKRNRLLIQATTWMDVKGMFLSEKQQYSKVTE